MEWLDADGSGGYAAGTLSGVPSRRFHGLLLVARHPPHERIMLVNHVSEVLELPTGERVLGGSSAELPGEWPRCVSFTTWPIPTWVYDFDGVVIERSIARPRGTPHVIIRWRLLSSPGPIGLRLRPMLSGRKDHDVQTATNAIDTTPRTSEGRVSWQPHASFPRVYAYCRALYRHEPEWRLGVEYATDHERGEPWREDWWSPGELTLTLQPGQSATLVLSTEGALTLDGDVALDAESQRRRDAQGSPSGLPVFDALRRAATSFTVDFAGGSACLAGFPWFDVWTRDTFTSFGGLYLTTGDFASARSVLKTFSRLAEGGMIPANLPDAHTKPRWNAADAPLWFILSVGRYLRYTRDASALDEFAMAAVRAIVDGYSAGTPKHIRVTPDGLVYASAPDQALTWMDAEYEGHLMTPRRGKPVEIQALWVHALAVARDLAERTGDHAFAARCEAMRAKATQSFRARFWNAKVGFLFDVIDGPDGDDATLRPNQVFAIGLEDDLLPRDQALAVLTVIDERLRTPLGLRTLATDDPRYHGQYLGDQSKRDPAYHQGTVWPFLLGPFISAWVRLHGRTEKTRLEALGFLTVLAAHVDGDACIGHLSEIFDGDAPHAPRGCFAQAWSSGELLGSLADHIMSPAGRLPRSIAERTYGQPY
jgi:predicted glycogen debranching enzyme